MPSLSAPLQDKGAVLDELHAAAQVRPLRFTYTLKPPSQQQAPLLPVREACLLASLGDCQLQAVDDLALLTPGLVAHNPSVALKVCSALRTMAMSSPTT